MYFKLSVNNIKKSYKDYLVYFLTISFGICLYYLFNSMESQQMMLVLDQGTHKSLEMLSGALSYISFFMTIVLAFLMVYANQFLIKRRKKELGIYMTLGMERIKISYVLVLETLFIGIISFAVGIFLGVIGSHFLSILTAKMFLVDMKPFQFIFSAKAFFKSALNFGVIYGLVMVLNVFNISKIKLIDLIYAKKKNQNIKMKSLYISIPIFVLSILSLIYAYYCIHVNGMMSIDGYFKNAIIFGLIGTFLFFMSLTSILLQLFKLHKKVYYKNLNMFSLRQINSKVNTTFVMLAIICILLLIAIGTFSTGMGIASVVNDTQDKSLPYVLTLRHELNDDDALLNIKVPYIDEIDGHYQIARYYESDLTLPEVVDVSNYKGSFISSLLNDYRVEFISLTDYNLQLKMQDQSPVKLKDDEYILNGNMSDFLKIYDEEFIKPIEINGHQLNHVLTQDITTRNEFMLATICLIVVPDLYVQYLTLMTEVVNFDKVDGDIFEISDTLISKRSEGVFMMILPRELVIAESLGIKTIVAYLSLYVGIVFIMSSVVCLALQQLTDASDNVERYNLLRKLGVENSQIRHSLLIQISVYFLLPLSLAIVHSIVGIREASNVVNIFGQLDILKNMIVTSLFVVGIYGSYFIITYVASSSIVIRKKY